MPGAVHMIRKTSEDPKLTTLAKLEALNKQDVKVKARLSTEGVPQMHTDSLSKDW